MGKPKCKHSSVWMFVLVFGFLTQNLVIPVLAIINFENQKNYYPTPDPHARTPPTGSPRTPSHGTTPSHGGGGSSSGTSPSHGGGGSYGGTPPSHGRGGSYGGNPPSHPSPSNPSPGNCGNPPSIPTPSNPPSRGGGYYPSPPIGGTPPTTPTIPTPSTPPYVPTPSTPPYVPTPTTPATPSVPSPPYIPDPNSPFTCNYWRNHPGLIWGLFGWWGTVGSAFGVSSLPGVGATMTLQQALSNTRTDGYGALYREGTASMLNSMVTNRFPFSTKQVRDSFISALRSNKDAAAQGHLFKMANEGKLKLKT